jgi:hypothetical protein
MAILSNPAFGPRTAITYVTIGLLIDVWTGVWYFSFGRPAGVTLSNTTSFWLAGFFLSGLCLIGIGLFLGPLGRAARKAELPPTDAMDAEATIQQTAAAVPNPVVATPAAPVAPVAMNGIPQMPAPLPSEPARPIVMQQPVTAGS